MGVVRRLQIGPGMSADNIEWARVDADAVIVATAERAWLERESAGGRFARPMAAAGTVATTRKLLDGAIGAAWSRAPRGEAPPPMTRLRWVWRLAGYYQLTHATARLMAAAAQRFAAGNRPALAAWAAEKAREEQGHDRLALRDIESLGYAADQVVLSLVPPTAKALLAHFSASVAADDPIGCVGYAYTLERLALTVGAQDIAAVQALLPPGVDATRCMRVHSAIGSDAEHVADDVAVIAGLPAGERAQVVAAVYTTALLCVMTPSEGHISEAALAELLAPLMH